MAVGVSKRGRELQRAAARDVPCSDSDLAPGSTAVEARLLQGPADPEATVKLVGPSESWPLAVRVELVVVDGSAGAELLREQAATVVGALRWFADHRPDRHRERHDGRTRRRPGSPPGAGRPPRRGSGARRPRP